MEQFIHSLSEIFSLNAGLFVHLATLGYVLGFLFKNQFVLRILVMAATVSYIIYYYAYPAEPLWGAIFGSLLIMAANVVGLIRLIYDRLPIHIEPAYQKIFDNMKGLQPGSFRKLMKIGQLETATTQMLLTEQGQHPKSLFYILEGETSAARDQHHFKIPVGSFIGEVSFILGKPATATVMLQEKAVYLRWDRERLLKTLEKNPELQQAFEAQIGRDMATKVSVSNPLDEPNANPKQDSHIKNQLLY